MTDLKAALVLLKGICEKEILTGVDHLATLTIETKAFLEVSKVAQQAPVSPSVTGLERPVFLENGGEQTQLYSQIRSLSQLVQGRS